jgi:hypothetical protein
MKCIRSKVGEIRRVKEEEADLKVFQHGWVFVPKSEWKALRKPVQKVVEVSETLSELSIEEKKLARKKRKK